MGKSIELAKILYKRKINIVCVHETGWVGNMARQADGFDLWYSRRVRGKNVVGILVDRDLMELVVEVKRVNNRLMAIKIVVGGGDFNDHIGRLLGGYDNVHGGFSFGDINRGGTLLLEYAKAFELDKDQELGEKLLAIGARSSGDASCMWSMIANCIKATSRKVLGVSKGFSGGHKGNWWWNEEVQRKVEAKKMAYLKLVESIDEGQKRANRKARKEAKLAVIAAKTVAFSSL
ncbi:PREDICTED: uncharacterized protein LOC109214672 [Nicotiana attenuata]|uniref:uncharacterized protein LOC109214672 n=1 Tax=Nicotiana attenuata TaxID=49451 RepID=UPI000904BEC1|nr:PREDICTED: uncharacterized protein LOC109214672 [Nicotiana attenuata]